MNFEPKTRANRGLQAVAKGEYGLEIVEVEEKKKSGAGNDMFVLRVRVSNDNGASRVLTDYLCRKGLEAL